MNQGKGIIPVIVSCVIVAAVFLVVSFAVPFVRTDTYWIAYAFAWVAIIVAFAANAFVVLTARSMRSALYRASISAISIGYLVVAAIVSLVFMAISTLPSWVLIVVQVVLLALCLLSLVGSAGGAVVVERDEAATQSQVAFMSDMRMQANSFLPLASDPETRKALTSLSDKLRYTDPVSSPATAAVDQQIASGLSQIAMALQAADLPLVQATCSQVVLVIEQREAICRSTKRA